MHATFRHASLHVTLLGVCVYGQRYVPLASPLPKGLPVTHSAAVIMLLAACFLNLISRLPVCVCVFPGLMSAD